MRKIYRGEIYYADLGYGEGSEQRGVRPVLILQNNIGNEHSTTVIVAPFTTKRKKLMPTHMEISSVDNLCDMSVILLEQIRTIDKKRLKIMMGRISQDELSQVENCVNISLGLSVI
ncbi:MAG: type II toxin-antitoxin system PemK/MazF family toxin [Clostridia bacterium]